nr:hypothetical protein [Desulfobulbaceae bacterium]
MQYDKNKTKIYNIIFVVICGGLLLFLLNAPDETTKRLPTDDIHNKYQAMDKKEAETFCETCHNPKGEVPLPANHPPKYRCLFCHKKAAQ